MFQKTTKILSFISILFLISACSSGKWSNKEKQEFTQECLGSVNTQTNYGKLMKKYCECGTDHLSKLGKRNELTQSDEYTAIAVCMKHIKGKKAEEALRKDMGF